MQCVALLYLVCIMKYKLDEERAMKVEFNWGTHMWEVKMYGEVHEFFTSGEANDYLALCMEDYFSDPEDPEEYLS